MRRSEMILVFVAASLAAILITTSYREAWAHTGSPAIPTFADGNTLTAADLNNAFAHIHNTFSGLITDTHVSSSAAILHSKLAIPALLPKAMAVVTADCDGGSAAGTDCTVGDSSQIPSADGVETTGTDGVYRVNLSYTPTNTSYVVIVTSHTAAAVCTTLASARATSAPHFDVRCYDYAGVLVTGGVQFSVMVMDT